MDDDDNGTSAAQALGKIIEVLSRLDEASRARVLKSVSTFFGSNAVEEDRSHHYSSRPEATQNPVPSHTPQRPSFSQKLDPSPKQFLFEKRPQTDVERVACLAYYLTHFRDTPHFTTLDLAQLNTEAAQPKFSNTSYAANNALNAGYLVAATKNTRQLSAPGELFVMALPDREAARNAMTSARRKSARRKKAE
ncbi:hypothetical protein [Bradyrhizobium sp. 1]|uniref:hypothetical protein n=1 Tax=Bradyrhizobium sp. 1 TaxID=241591 RepID=UPI001FF8821D|nr:hypothetical protein [Bradyrhizobium sp. 1]MCK1391685.1 hypothetical protein [Bradyrhizobium sp. 1]